MVTIVWLVWLALLAGNDPTDSVLLESVLVAMVLFGILFSGDVIESILATGWMTYRRIDDQFVAVDRLTDEPQWSAPVETLRNVAVVDTVFPDRWFGTRTFTVTVGRDDDEE
ncbi:hypothetical protein [Halocatena pleomorpha]|uniref:Uncharacterized protein n=1 Tax=Halocatena pleomorpha TaxID=1785090 RepID=A0A3P3RN02_9EURY|nr:hypothetical protein [Halocatena pleomorpha]RRJ34229.1 hypothetical protein EIK79_00155 [Halocatena pleomorpha]